MPRGPLWDHFKYINLDNRICPVYHYGITSNKINTYLDK